MSLGAIDCKYCQTLPQRHDDFDNDDCNDDEEKDDDEDEDVAMPVTVAVAMRVVMKMTMFVVMLESDADGRPDDAGDLPSLAYCCCYHFLISHLAHRGCERFCSPVKDKLGSTMVRRV